MPGPGFALSVLGLLTFLVASAWLAWLDGPGGALTLAELRDVVAVAEGDAVVVEVYSDWGWMVAAGVVAAAVAFSVLGSRSRLLRTLVSVVFLGGPLGLLSLLDRRGVVVTRLVSIVMLLVPAAAVLAVRWQLTNTGDRGLGVPASELGPGLWASLAGLAVTALGCLVGTRPSR